LRRRLLRWFLWFAAFYVGVVLVLLWFENALLYHPLRDSDSWEPPPAGVKVEDVWLNGADGTRIHGWWFPHADSHGALLYLHGNAGNLSHRGHVAPLFMKSLGVSVLFVDYPGYGKSDGQPSEGGCYAAGFAAYDWLTKTKQIPAENVILFGKSLGGGVAVELAVNRPHRALVLAKAFTSIPDMAQRQFPFLPARWLVTNRYDNLAKIGRCPRPIFIAHGDRDGLIPFSQGQRLFEAAPEPKKFLVLPNGDHNDPFPAAFFTALAEFLKEQTPLPAAADSRVTQ
jgi:fermentation-respiration switch protein FrsA (DUF1100 family)